MCTALLYHQKLFLLYSSLPNSLPAYLFIVRLKSVLASQQIAIHDEMTQSNPSRLMEHEMLFQVTTFASSRVRSNMCGHSLKLHN